MSFVKNAPEIAEEILLKAASLPEGLRSFSRSLLEKQAVDTREKLQLPVRMTLADLQKMAHSNEVDLPKVASVKSDDFADIAGQLRKIAERRDEELAHEIFETAAALVAARHEKTAIGPVGPVPHLNIPTGFSLREKIVGTLAPGTFTGKRIAKEHARLSAEVSAEKANIHGSPENTAKAMRDSDVKSDKRMEAAGKRHSKLVDSAIKGLPAIATGGAAAVIGAGKLTEKEKGTTINTEKLIGAGR